VITRGEKARLDRGLFGICLGFLLVTLDATIVNVALETIQDALGGSLATSQWIVSAYTVTFGALMLSAGAFVDRLGARRCFELGLLMFILGSAFCSLAGSMGVLDRGTSRTGVGPAFLMPSILALMVDAFPDPGPRRRALTMWAGVSEVGRIPGDRRARLSDRGRLGQRVAHHPLCLGRTRLLRRVSVGRATTVPPCLSDGEDPTASHSISRRPRGCGPSVAGQDLLGDQPNGH
jgi:hypothetical protein